MVEFTALTPTEFQIKWGTNINGMPAVIVEVHRLDIDVYSVVFSPEDARGMARMLDEAAEKASEGDREP